MRGGRIVMGGVEGGLPIGPRKRRDQLGGNSLDYLFYLFLSIVGKENKNR